ncbi:MAG TPA: hypothetical protein VF365_08285 [Candidatus Limnocylindria bacterium]
MTGRNALLQLRIVGIVLKHERMQGRRPGGLRERASVLIEQAAEFLDGENDGRDALEQARRELALLSRP